MDNLDNIIFDMNDFKIKGKEMNSISIAFLPSGNWIVAESKKNTFFGNIEDVLIYIREIFENGVIYKK